MLKYNCIVVNRFIELTIINFLQFGGMLKPSYYWYLQ